MTATELYVVERVPGPLEHTALVYGPLDPREAAALVAEAPATRTLVRTRSRPAPAACPACGRPLRRGGSP